MEEDIASLMIFNAGDKIKVVNPNIISQGMPAKGRDGIVIGYDFCQGTTPIEARLLVVVYLIGTPYTAPLLWVRPESVISAN